MAELKLPFHFTPTKQEFPADQVEVNFETLRKLVQDLDEKVEAFNDLVVSGTFENTDKIETDNSGNVVQASQPAFFARMSTDEIDAGTTFDAFDFDTEIYDQNADYDNTTFTFTAPKTGIYAFTFSMYAEETSAATGAVLIGFDTSNRNYILGFTKSGFGDIKALGWTVLADMDANDTCVLGKQDDPTATGTITYYASGSSFAGTLIN